MRLYVFAFMSYFMNASNNADEGRSRPIYPTRVGLHAVCVLIYTWGRLVPVHPSDVKV